jgi:hypothetical protein
VDIKVSVISLVSLRSVLDAGRKGFIGGIVIGTGSGTIMCAAIARN